MKSLGLKCREFEAQVCDYLDDALAYEARSEMDAHRVDCPACAEALEEADFARIALSRAPVPEAPPELIADIIHDTIGVGTGLALEPAGGPAEGLWGWLRPVFQPVLQPRFVMGMAMTALSASTISFYGRQALERWQDSGTTPAAAVESVEQGVDGAWERAAEILESAKELYRLQWGDNDGDEGNE